MREKLEAAVASQTLEVQLQAIQLDLVPGSGAEGVDMADGEQCFKEGCSGAEQWLYPYR